MTPRRKKPRLPAGQVAGDWKRRLLLAMELGGLTVADLSQWFERGYITVYSWVIAGKAPRPSPRADDAERRLKLLEKTLRSDKRFPIPASVAQHARADYMKGIYRDVSIPARSALRGR